MRDRVSRALPAELPRTEPLRVEPSRGREVYVGGCDAEEPPAEGLRVLHPVVHLEEPGAAAGPLERDPELPERRLGREPEGRRAVERAERSSAAGEGPSFAGLPPTREEPHRPTTTRPFRTPSHARLFQRGITSPAFVR